MDKWVIDLSDPEPQGELVPLTPEEEAQSTSDQADWTVVSEAEAVAEANEALIRQQLSDGLADIVALAELIENDLASDAEQQQALVLCLQATAGITRLQLSQLDEV
jgi:hypothetical protein